MLAALVQVRQAQVVQQVPEVVQLDLVREPALALEQVLVVPELALEQELAPDQGQTGNHPEIRNT